VDIHIYQKRPVHPEGLPRHTLPDEAHLPQPPLVGVFPGEGEPPVRETVEVIFATIAVSRAAERAKKAEEEKDKGLGRSNKD
jgi:hypothetical protein